MQVNEQTRIQKKRAKMAAKKQAKESGIPLPKKSREYKPHKKTEPKRIEKPKVSKYVQAVARTHIDLLKQMELERNLDINENDVDYPEKPAYEMEFYVSYNAKNLGTALEFPEERVVFMDAKKSCPELCKMLAEIGLKATLAKIDTMNGEDWTPSSIRLFIHEKNQSPLFRYHKKDELPNFMESASVRTTDALLTLDLYDEGNQETKLYLTNIDGERISIGSYLLDDSMVVLDLETATFDLAKDIEYSMRCALCASLEGKLYKLANEYFGGDIVSMFLPQRIIG